MVVVAMGVVVGLFSPSVAAVGQSWIARWTMLVRLKCACIGLAAAVVAGGWRWW